MLISIIDFLCFSAYALTQDLSEGSVATLVATIGITNTIGRIVCGWVSDHPKVRSPEYEGWQAL